MSPQCNGLIVVVYKYRQNDFTPYIFQTSDYGQTWRRLTDGANGIPDDHWVRVVREDPDRRGLLYAGTEFGMWAPISDSTRPANSVAERGWVTSPARCNNPRYRSPSHRPRTRLDT